MILLIKNSFTFSLKEISDSTGYSEIEAQVIRLIVSFDKKVDVKYGI